MSALPPIFSLVELLTNSAGYELHRLRNNPLSVFVINQQMDVIGCPCVIQNDQPVSFLRLKKPLQPTMTIFDILQQKFSLMTSVGDMPNMPWYVMPMCPCHWNPSISPFLMPKNKILPYKMGCFIKHVSFIQLVILVRPFFTSSNCLIASMPVVWASISS